MRKELDREYLAKARVDLDKAKESYRNSIDKKKDIRNRFGSIGQEMKSSHNVILFSHFALEAYINKIGHDYLDPNIWENLSDISMRKKYSLIPLLITGKKFDKKRGIKQLTNWRNDLVHYKDFDLKEPVPHDSGTDVPGIYDIIKFKNAEKAYNCAKSIIDKLEKFLEENKK
ncbi:hypothetical protein KJA15_00195 [Patescibacteria group bacterium]|nr:hypothetical protein [Patescibacteria group bacterium]